MSDKLIPARASQANLDMQKILSKQFNLTISFDGLTKGNQSFYTVHVTTPDRHVFLYTADVFRGSHNAEYVQSLLKRVVDEIGVSRIAAVVSDDTNTTKKARRDFTADNPSVLNLADPIHKINLIAKDICMDPEWKEMFHLIREIHQYFGHSTQASTRLSESREDLSIPTGLVAISKSRFSQSFLSADSVCTNLPAMHLAHRKGLFSSVPTRLERVFDESSMQATKFKMALIQFTVVLEPIYRALTCLESSNSTLADVFAYWLAMIAALDRHFSSPECTLPLDVISRFRAIINTRYLESLIKAPTNVYILGFFLHLDFRNADVFRRMNAMSSNLYIQIPASSPTSPVPHIPDSVYTRIRQAGNQTLRHLLKQAESDPTHILHDYDAQNAKAEFEAQLGEEFTGTIAENIAYGQPTVVRSEIEACAKLANCESIWELPDRFDTRISQDSLSGGQRQRLAIARALMKKPILLCLDEATSALDALSELRVNEAIERILQSNETSTLIVAHRLSTISRAKRIVVLEDGKIVEEGTYPALVANPDSKFRALMAAQLEAL